METEGLSNDSTLQRGELAEKVVEVEIFEGCEKVARGERTERADVTRSTVVPREALSARVVKGERSVGSCTTVEMAAVVRVAVELIKASVVWGDLELVAETVGGETTLKKSVRYELLSGLNFFDDLLISSTVF